MRQVMAADQGRLRPFEVCIKWVAAVSIKSLLHFIGCALSAYCSPDNWLLDDPAIQGMQSLDPKMTAF